MYYNINIYVLFEGADRVKGKRKKEGERNVRRGRRKERSGERREKRRGTKEKGEKGILVRSLIFCY